MKLPFWATLLTLLGLIILCGLGTWQLQRLAWKNDIMTKLDAAYNGSITKLDFEKIGENDFAYGSIEGAFLFDKAILLGYSLKREKPGQTLIVPLATNQGTLLVNMGWNDQDWTLSDHFLNNYQGEKIRFTGLVRKPGWNIFTPQNKPEDDQWYRPDITQIVTTKNLKNPIPLMLYADFASRKFDAQFPNNERWEPKNNHLQYAIFWFTMALALVTIYLLRFIKQPGKG